LLLYDFFIIFDNLYLSHKITSLKKEQDSIHYNAVQLMEIPFLGNSLGNNLSKQVEVPKPKSDAPEIKPSPVPISNRGGGNPSGKSPKGDLSPGRKPKIFTIVLISVLAVGGIAIALRFVNRGASDKINLESDTVAVVTERVPVKIRASGTIVPIQSVNLSPKQSGKLMELYVEQGIRVKKGQMIARMDNSNLIPQFNQARANVAALEANLIKLRNGNRPEEIAAAEARLAAAQGRLQASQSRQALAQVRRERFTQLQNEGAVSRDRLDESVTDDRNTQADVVAAQASVAEAVRNLEQLRNGPRVEDIAAAEAQLAQGIAQVENIQVLLEDTIIRAPFDGIITQKYSNPGAFVTPTTSASANNSATSTSIVAIASGLEVLAKVPETDIQQIRVNQEVEVVADAFPGKTFRGKVRLIAPEAIVEQNVTSFQVRVTLETGADVLQSGMNIDLRFVGKVIDNALLVPTVAITTQEGKTGLLIPDSNGKPVFRPVVIGTTIDNRTQVLSGVESGERVFVKSPDPKQGGRR